MKINENPGLGRSRHPNLVIPSPNVEFWRPPTSIFSIRARRQRRQPVNAPRQGSALPLTACQISYNVLLTQRYTKKAKLKQCFKNLMPSRKAQGVRFTLPLAPFLTAMENSVCRKMQHSHTKALLFSECVILPARQRSRPMPPISFSSTLKMRFLIKKLLRNIEKTM